MRQILLSITMLMISQPGLVRANDASTPVGAWDATVTPTAFPVFKALHVFNFGGTTTNTPSVCNAIVPAPTGVRCTVAYGSWVRSSGARYVQTFMQQVYNNAGQLIGYAKTRGVFELVGKDTMKGSNESFFLVGTDPFNPISIVPLGTDTFTARRIEPELPVQ